MLIGGQEFLKHWAKRCKGSNQEALNKLHNIKMCYQGNQDRMKNKLLLLKEKKQLLTLNS